MYQADATGQASSVLRKTIKALNWKIDSSQDLGYRLSDLWNEEGKSPGANDLEDLLYQATLALARIFAKQGGVYAKLDSHFTALVRTAMFI